MCGITNQFSVVNDQLSVVSDLGLYVTYSLTFCRDFGRGNVYVQHHGKSRVLDNSMFFESCELIFAYRYCDNPEISCQFSVVSAQ